MLNFDTVLPIYLYPRSMRVTFKALERMGLVRHFIQRDGQIYVQLTQKGGNFIYEGGLDNG